jgi:hypothetical protein
LFIMEYLLRTLVAMRGLILAGTLLLAAAGSYLDRGTTAPIGGLNSHLESPVHAVARSQIRLQWNKDVLCTHVSPIYEAHPCR